MNFLRRLLVPPPPVLGRWNSVVVKQNSEKFMDQGNFDYCYQNIKLIRDHPIVLDNITVETLRNYFKNKNKNEFL